MRPSESVGKHNFIFTSRDQLPMRLRKTMNHCNCPQFLPIVKVNGSYQRRVLVGITSAGYAIISKPLLHGRSLSIGYVPLDYIQPLLSEKS